VDSLGSTYDLVEAAPLHKDGFVQVPKVIGE
jgi:Asp-tRNA(Asn)/Glu-tRNA(Gln) amidotransferase C subunit